MEILEEISWFVRPISCPVLVILPSSPLSHSCLSPHSFCHLSHLGYRASKQALWKIALTSTDSPKIPPTISPCYNPLIHNSQKTPRNLPETHYSKFITPRQRTFHDFPLLAEWMPYSPVYHTDPPWTGSSRNLTLVFHIPSSQILHSKLFSFLHVV